MHTESNRDNKQIERRNIMGIKTYNPYTPSRRQMTGSDFSEITKKTPEKSLLVL